jgi:hypothetical protein
VVRKVEILPIDVNNSKEVQRFLDFPFRLYAKTQQWVPPLASDARRIFDPRRHPFYQSGEAAFWLALGNEKQVVGRLAVLDDRKYNQYNQEHTAFFYLFECQDDLQAATGLFEAGFDWARRRGLQRIEGPKGFTPFDGIGLLVRGFEHRPAFGLPYNLPYYAQLVEAAGFSAAGELLSGYLSAHTLIPDRIHQVADALIRRRGLRVAHYRTRRELRALAAQLKDLYNSSLGGTHGNAPLTDAEVKALADQMIWFADPRLIKIVFKGDQPVGFLFAYPDVSAAVQRTRGRLFPLGWLDLLLELRRTRWININGAGMIEGYRGLGGTALLFSEMQKSVVECNYEHADIVQIGVENANMQRELRDLGIDFYKAHCLYARQL